MKLHQSMVREQTGSVGLLFALLAIPLTLFGGLAIDYTRGMSVKHQLQVAADAAALAAKGTGDNAEQAAREAAEAYVHANATRLNGATLGTVVVVNTGEGIRVDLTASMPTMIAGVVGYERFDVNVTSESTRATGDIEIALVLDNTGSMAGSMDDLKTGAKDLVAAIYGNASATSNKIKFAVVPYVGAVNIGNGVRQMDWMDVSADNPWHGHGIEGQSFGYEPGCTYTPGGGGSIDPGSGTHGWLEDAARKFASLAGGLIGIRPALAASASDVPSPYVFWPDCWAANPFKVNLFDYFARIPNAPWKGCVMARTEWSDYDVSDTPPDTSDPSSLFVPWFWPDTIDASAIAANDPTLDVVNDYLPDRLDLRDAQFPKFTDAWMGWGHQNFIKYRNVAGTIDETGPDTLGPNKACPDPIQPLVSNRATVEAKIDNLTHWNGSGTNTAEGMAWGMRVLTPAEPFDEGSADPATQKVLVLMTDGVNNIDPTNDSSLLSHYSTYGYLAHGRVQPMSYDGFRTYTNQRMQKACEFAKAENIQIYTVAFNVTDEATLTLLRDCATKPPYAYSASTASELVDAFRSIGTSLTELRLSR